MKTFLISIITEDFRIYHQNIEAVNRSIALIKLGQCYPDFEIVDSYFSILDDHPLSYYELVQLHVAQLTATLFEVVTK